ncbi:type III-A CRISPR-associated protein Cas10/Csm1 [Thermococcus sp.]
MRLSELVSLGGLLHDVGKPVQRAGLYPGDHSRQGAEFLRELARNTKKEEFELLALFSEFHHIDHLKDETVVRRKIKEVVPGRFGLSEEELYRGLWIVYEADNLSAGERGEGKVNISRPLRAVFNPERAYPVAELDVSSLQSLPFPSRPVPVKGDAYRRIVKLLWDELSSVPIRTDRVLPILEKYLTFVSSFTTENNVISLYDHMRMTSAIALAMLRSGCTAEDVKNGKCRKEKRFLLIEGDFSGIQNFIYGVTGKGTLKYLRARSSYLDLIGWDVVLEILSRLGLTRANVIFNAGGHFLIIAQNTAEALQELEDIRKKTVKWLYSEFDGSIYLAIEWEPVTGEELGRRGDNNLFADARKRLKERLTLRKLRRFGEVEGLFKEPKAGGRLEECSVCGKEVPESELESFRLSDDPNLKACKTCKELFRLGEKLPKLKGFVLDRKAHEGEGIAKGPFRYFIPYEAGGLKGESLLLKNTLDPPENLGDTLFVPYFVADYFKRSKERGVATFTELAGASTGAKRIGIIKGDVDRLGEFFGTMDSPSKLATASRFMDYFFKGYLRAIIEGKFSDIIGEVPSLRKWPEEPDIVVVYAGGDDFFIAGAWDQTFELAFRIRNTFRAYTGEGLTLSMGVGYFDEKTPIYRIAEAVSERLERAKDEGRNRIFVVERSRPKDRKHALSYRWEQYEELWNSYKPRIYAGDGRLSGKLESKKGLLWRLLEFRELYVRDPKSVKWAYLTAYLLGRHKLSDLFPELVGIDVKKFQAGEPQPIYWVDGVLKIVLMAIRG